MATFSTFGLTGSGGQLGSVPGSVPQATGATPAARALNSAQLNAGANYLRSSMGVPTAPTPSAPVKKQVITHPDGTSVETHYDNTQPKTSGLIGTNVQKSATNVATPTGYIKANQGGTTPSGAVVDAEGNIVSAPPATEGTFSGYLNKLAATGQANIPIGETAQNIANQYQKDIAQTLGGGIGEALGYAKQPGGIGAGNELALYNAATGRAQALTQAEQAALQGTGQQLTAQQQAASALGTAGQLTQPSGAFPFVFNPSTGQFQTSGGGVLSPQAAAQQLAQGVIAGTIPYSDAVSALGYAGNVGQELLTAAINAQGGDLTQIQAQQQAKQTNIGLTGTAEKQAASDGFKSALQESQNANENYSKLTGISGQVIDSLSTWKQNGILTNVNTALNNIASITSDPNYQTFITALINAQATYTNILGSSSIPPTQADKDAVNALNPSSSADAIVAALNQLSKDAHAMLVIPANQKVQSYAKMLGIQ